MFRFKSAIAPAVLAALTISSAYIAPAQAQQATASGEVRRVDAAAGKITIKHGDIPELGLSAMTLVYQADPALLQGVQPGDTVRFTVKRENGHYLITALSK